VLREYGFYQAVWFLRWTGAKVLRVTAADVSARRHVAALHYLLRKVAQAGRCGGLPSPLRRERSRSGTGSISAVPTQTPICR
jgi:hypothetical protein